MTVFLRTRGKEKQTLAMDCHGFMDRVQPCRSQDDLSGNLHVEQGQYPLKQSQIGVFWPWMALSYVHGDIP